MKQIVCAILVLAWLLLTQTGCRTCNCTDGEIRVHFYGFTVGELDTIVVQRYTAGSNFGALVQNTQHVQGVDFRVEQRADTLYLNPSNGDLQLNRGFDYRIDLPVTGNSYHITDIRMLQVREQCNGKTICTNPVHSLRINGVLLEGPFSGLNGIVLRQ